MAQHGGGETKKERGVRAPWGFGVDHQKKDVFITPLLLTAFFPLLCVHMCTNTSIHVAWEGQANQERERGEGEGVDQNSEKKPCSLLAFFHFPLPPPRPKPTPFLSNPHPQPAPHTMATTFLDLPADVWEKIAQSLLDAGRHYTRRRFALALACKELYAALVEAPTGAAWSNLRVELGRGDEAHVKPGGLRQLEIFAPYGRVDDAGMDAATRLLQGAVGLQRLSLVYPGGGGGVKLAGLVPVVQNCRSLTSFSEYCYNPNPLTEAAAANSGAVGAFVGRLQRLTLRHTASLAFLGAASRLTSLTFEKLYSVPDVDDLPFLPSVVRLGLYLEMDLTYASALAEAVAQRLVNVSWLAFYEGDGALLALFLSSLAGGLTRLDVKDTNEPPPHLPAGLALKVMNWSVYPFEDEGRRVPDLASQPLSHLVILAHFMQVFHTPAASLSASPYAALRCLDLRICKDWRGATLPSPLDVFDPASHLPQGALPSLRCLMIGDRDFNTRFQVDLATFAAWRGAAGLVVLLIEGAWLTSTRAAAAVAADLATNKPALLSVHMHACRVIEGKMDAVAALTERLERVCRLGREACMVGAPVEEEGEVFVMPDV